MMVTDIGADLSFPKAIPIELPDKALEAGMAKIPGKDGFHLGLSFDLNSFRISIESDDVVVVRILN